MVQHTHIFYKKSNLEFSWSKLAKINKLIFRSYFSFPSELFGFCHFSSSPSVFFSVCFYFIIQMWCLQWEIKRKTYWVRNYRSSLSAAKIKYSGENPNEKNNNENQFRKKIKN